MIKLRKLTGYARNYHYTVELVELLPNRETSRTDTLVPSRQTNIRKLQNFLYEMQDKRHGDDWKVISEADYLRILHNHKNPKVIIKGKERRVKEIFAEHVFIMTNHFVDRCKDRFANLCNGVDSVMNFVLDNGYIINDPYIRQDLLDEGKFIIYEPDLRMLIVASDTENGIVLITTYEPQAGWFKGWLDRNDYRKQPRLRRFVEEHYALEK